MTLSMYSASVPLFKQMLGSLTHLLDKAEAHVTERKIEPDAILQSRLFPDMFPFVRQVQLACDFAKSAAARLAGEEVPSHPDTEKTFAELRARIEKTLAVVNGVSEASFAGSEQREIVLRPGTPRERRFDGRAYLLGYAIPQFFFHHSMVYALLRHNGVEVGKADYMGL